MTLAVNAISAKPINRKTFGKIVGIDACRKNKSLKDSNPQLIGENRLTACKASGIT
jgi:hypothetical protein